VPQMTKKKKGETDPRVQEGLEKSGWKEKNDERNKKGKDGCTESWTGNQESKKAKLGPPHDKKAPTRQEEKKRGSERAEGKGGGKSSRGRKKVATRHTEEKKKKETIEFACRQGKKKGEASLMLPRRGKSKRKPPPSRKKKKNGQQLLPIRQPRDESSSSLRRKKKREEVSDVEKTDRPLSQKKKPAFVVKGGKEGTISNKKMGRGSKIGGDSRRERKILCASFSRKGRGVQRTLHPPERGGNCRLLKGGFA